MYPPYDFSVAIHPNISLLTHPHPVPPLEGEGNILSLRERIKPALNLFQG